MVGLRVVNQRTSLRIFVKSIFLKLYRVLDTGINVLWEVFGGKTAWQRSSFGDIKRVFGIPDFEIGSKMSSFGGHNRFTFVIIGFIHLHWMNLGFNCVRASVCQGRVFCISKSISLILRRPTAFWWRNIVHIVKLDILWRFGAAVAWVQSVIWTSLLDIF